MNASDILQFVVPMGAYPAPVDYAVEIKTARAIVDFCEVPLTRVDFETMQRFAPTTPWVAWQLGIAAERAIAESQHTFAIKLANASVHAAYMCNSTDYTYANLLICGNVLVQCNEHEKALDVYKTLLRLPLPAGWSPRAGAHLAMGSIYRLYLGDLRLSIYHYEHAMRFVGPRSNPAKLLVFWKSLSLLYRDADDSVGMILCLCQIKHPQAESLIMQAIKGSLNKKLALRSRLLRQGNQTMADFVKECPI
jgi:tetratricopeptide (TPR) repeat protein